MKDYGYSDIGNAVIGEDVVERNLLDRLNELQIEINETIQTLSYKNIEVEIKIDIDGHVPVLGHIAPKPYNSIKLLPKKLL